MKKIIIYFAFMFILVNNIYSQNDSTKKHLSIEDKFKDLAIKMCSPPILKDFKISRLEGSKYPNYYKVTITKVHPHIKKFTLENKKVIKYFNGKKNKLNNIISDLYFINVTDTFSNLEYFLVGVNYDYSCPKIYKLIGFGKLNDKKIRKKLKKYYGFYMEENYLQHIENTKYKKKYNEKYYRNFNLYLRKNKKNDNFKLAEKKCVKIIEF